MIRTASVNNKTYEERINEAVASIPIYTDEWTNYNASDPGITILENLSLFETLQQDNINDLPAAVKGNLLRMAGFVPHKGKCAKVLLQPKGIKAPFDIPKGHKFMVYDVPFEATRNIRVENSSIVGVYVKDGDEITDISYVGDPDARINCRIFSDNPHDGVEIYIITNGLARPEAELIFYADIKDSDMRNDIADISRDVFASLEWEYYSAKGFSKIHAKDETYGFIKSGELRLRIGDEWPAEFSGMPKTGYCIKATLKNCAYDIVPVVQNIYGFLFELTQQNSKSYSITGTKASGISFMSSVEANNYITVFAKEEKGGSYYRYDPIDANEKAKGRYYTISEGEDGLTTYSFNKRSYGYGPEKGRACVRVLIYNEEIMKSYKIGKVLGYDDQEFVIPFSNLVPDSFSVLAKRINENGEEIYDFVRPGHSESGNLYYLLNDRDGIITIRDAGDFIGAELFMASCSVYLGSLGNVREGNVFKTEGLPSGIKFINPAKGHSGAFPEDLESVRKRFIKDIDSPYTAITANDYEKLSLSTPGLMIAKARAHFEEDESRVYVAVLPGGSDEEFPKLSADYIKRISERLSERRLLITKSSVVACVPVKVNVRATVYVKQHYTDPEKMIVNSLNKLLDFPHSDRGIGEGIRFDEVFKNIESLSCVEYVHSLSIKAIKSYIEQTHDKDIHPVWNGLIVPGHISIDVIAYNG